MFFDNTATSAYEPYYQDATALDPSDLSCSFQVRLLRVDS